jgi:DNA helicase-2/ATP-dependent DNA helicase PcrA
MLNEKDNQEFLQLRKKILESQFKRLNSPQKQAVFHINGPLLVLAGAGSGKTSVLVNRIAYMVKFGNAYHSDVIPAGLTPEDLQMMRELAGSAVSTGSTVSTVSMIGAGGKAIPGSVAFAGAEVRTGEGSVAFAGAEVRISAGSAAGGAGTSVKAGTLPDRITGLISERPVHPASILAITFTNKAAKEMKQRLEGIVGDGINDMWVSTFHASCVRILRRDIEKLGFGRSFVIFDTSDQQTLIKDCLKELNLNEKNFPVREVLSKIGQAKDELIEPDVYTRMNGSDFRLGKIAKIYELYQKKLKNNNALDFDDIIMLTIKLFVDNPPVLDYYQRKFKYVLVDEYQDTNTAQYTLISLLAKYYRNLCVVGDDDQCLAEGALVQTPAGTKPIQKIKAGDTVICAAGRGKSTTGVVDKATGRDYKGPAVKITTRLGKVIIGTPNHIGFAKVNAQQGIYYVYLMYKKGFGYRIGQTQGVRSRDGEIANGLFVRLNQEQGDKMWILHATDNKERAAYFEQLLAFKYGIPTTVFSCGGRSITLSQQSVNAIFDQIDTDSAAEMLLKDLCMFPEYPHHTCNAVIRGQTAGQIINVTAFGGRQTGVEPGWHSHRICLNTSGNDLRSKTGSASLPVRSGNRSTCRIETERSEYGEADIFAHKISRLDENLEIIKKAWLTEELSYSYMPLSHMKPSMSVAVWDNGRIIEDIIEAVEFQEYDGKVYDISVPHLRQFVCNDIVVHNSIYGWRGANIRNILDFEKEFKDSTVVKLEQNYRSTKTILNAANSVIKNNAGRKSKSLWTENIEGEGIQMFEAGNEHEEAAFIVSEIKRLMDLEGRSNKDFALLYRINAQSRVLEDALMKAAIPYRIYGGLRFYDRKEIRDIIAYLRLIQNPSDDYALKRIINVPKRGIGATTLETAENIALSRNCSIFSIIASAAEVPELQRASSKLLDFISMINDFRSKAEAMSVSELIGTVIDKSGILPELKAEDTVEAQTRIENIGELVSGVMEFEVQSEEKGLEAYLANVSLVSDIDNLDAEKDHIVLMTLHSAKGLEFPVVFIPGFEEGVFPGMRSMGSDDELEEERRLCYVGITRAKERLYFTSAYSRMLFGSTTYNKCSRFMKEIPEDFLVIKGRSEKKPDSFLNWQNRTGAGVHDGLGGAGGNSFGSGSANSGTSSSGTKGTSFESFSRTKAKAGTPFGGNTAGVFNNITGIPNSAGISGNTSGNASVTSGKAPGSEFKAGDNVVHKKFGVGKITSVTLDKEDYVIEIEFRNVGMKRLVAAFANLIKL